MNAFDIPAQSIFLRDDPAKSRAQQANERAWENGHQVNHKGKQPELVRKHVSNGNPRGRKSLAIDLDTARRLYAEHGSYRIVAKIMGVHMVTIHRRLTGRKSR